jgi:hypothetical protein
MIFWDQALHDQVGGSICTNGDIPCIPEGYIQHAGLHFSGLGPGQCLTATGGSTVGPVGGYGWILMFNSGSPCQTLSSVQKSFRIPHYWSAAFCIHQVWPHFASQCMWQIGANHWPPQSVLMHFNKLVPSLEQVCNGPGNLFHVQNSMVSLHIVHTNIKILSEWFQWELVLAVTYGYHFDGDAFLCDSTVFPWWDCIAIWCFGPPRSVESQLWQHGNLVLHWNTRYVNEIWNDQQHTIGSIFIRDIFSLISLVLSCVLPLEFSFIQPKC